MRPFRKDSLLSDAQDNLNFISKVVINRLLDDANASWSALVREFEDERSYLSLSLDTRPGDAEPTVQIEFGVQDEQQRHATGAFVARWSLERYCVEGLEIIHMDGKSCDISSFATKLDAYLELPATASEMDD